LSEMPEPRIVVVGPTVENESALATLDAVVQPEEAKSGLGQSSCELVRFILVVSVRPESNGNKK
jgi:hypothetical protein